MVARDRPDTNESGGWTNPILGSMDVLVDENKVSWGEGTLDCVLNKKVNQNALPDAVLAITSENEKTSCNVRFVVRHFVIFNCLGSSLHCIQAAVVMQNCPQSPSNNENRRKIPQKINKRREYYTWLCSTQVWVASINHYIYLKVAHSFVHSTKSDQASGKHVIVSGVFRDPIESTQRVNGFRAGIHHSMLPYEDDQPHKLLIHEFL